MLSNKAFNEAIGMGLLEDIREGRVLSVTIQGHHTSARITHLLQSDTVRLPGGDLNGQTKAIL